MDMAFTSEQVLDALRIVVNGKEDYVYRSDHYLCEYADNEGNPSCVVGHVVNHLDPELFKKLAQREKDTFESPKITRIGYDLKDGDKLAFTRGAIIVLGAAQSEQDGSGTWGEALAQAEANRAEGWRR